MRRTNLSLYYLAGYLLPAGALLLLVPEWATKLLLSNHTYDYAPFRLVGVLLIVVGILIVQIIRHRLEMLYTTTLVARTLISGTLLWLFVSTGDPFFAVILLVVLVGSPSPGRAITWIAGPPHSPRRGEPIARPPDELLT